MSGSQDLRSYLRLLCLVGIICAEFDSEKCLLRLTAASERYALCYTLTILVGIFGCFTYVYMNPQDLYVKLYNETGNFYETINLRCFCVGLWLLHICFYVRRRRHIELVQKLLQLHRLFPNPARERYFLRNFTIYKALVLVSLLTYFIGYFYSDSFSLTLMVYVFVYSYSFLVMCLPLMFFVCLQHIVAAGLAHHNRQLEQTSVMFKSRRFIFERYRLLGIITVELNQCFGLLMLPIVPLVLLTAPSGPLFLISTVLEGKFVDLFQYITMCISGCIWNVPWLAAMSFTLRSNVITVEANKTAKILAKIPRTGTGLDRMVEKFLLKNLRQQPILTAYGFFALDKSTLFKLFTAIFTYMVILVQFKEMENSTKSLQKTLD